MASLITRNKLIDLIIENLKEAKKDKQGKVGLEIEFGETSLSADSHMRLKMPEPRATIMITLPGRFRIE